MLVFAAHIHMSVPFKGRWINIVNIATIITFLVVAQTVFLVDGDEKRCFVGGTRPEGTSSWEDEPHDDFTRA